MSIRQSTLTKYMNAVHELEYLLAHGSGRIDSHAFARSNVVSAGTIGDLVKAGFLTKVAQGRYLRTSKPITVAGIKRMLEQRDFERGRTAQPDTTKAAANDTYLQSTGTQQPLGLVQPVEKPKTAEVSRADYEALERRIASLEQLIIRKGVA